MRGSFKKEDGTTVYLDKFARPVSRPIPALSCSVYDEPENYEVATRWGGWVVQHSRTKGVYVSFTTREQAETCLAKHQAKKGKP